MLALAQNLKRKTAFLTTHPHLVVLFILLVVGVIPLLYGFSREFLFASQPIPEHFALNTVQPQKETSAVLGVTDGSITFQTKAGFGYYNGGVMVLSSAEEPKIQLGSYKVQGKGNFRLYQVSKSDLLNYLIYTQNTDNQSGDNIKRVYQLDTNQLSQPTTFQTEIYASEGDSEKNPLTLPISGSGIWFLEGEVNGNKAETMIVRSNLASIIHEGDNENIFWVQDSNYQSVPSAQVELLNLQNGTNNLGTLTTNEAGIAAIAANQAADLALITKDADFTIVPVNLENLQYRSTGNGFFQSSFSQRVIGNQSFMFTDRFLYKPGDTVFFKAIVRSDDDADYTIARKTLSATFGSGENPLWQKTVVVDEVGSVDGGIPLPADLEPGYYSLNIKEGEAYVAYATIQVAKFRKPDSTIRITADKLAYLPGETLTAEIAGEYFLGQPARDQQVRYKVYQTKASVSGSYEDLEFETRTGYYGSESGEIIDEGTVTLDRKGMATLTLPVRNNTGFRQYWDVQLELLDAGSTATNDAIRVLVQPGDFVIEADNNKDAQVVVRQPVDYPFKLYRNKPAVVINNIKIKASLLVSEDYENYIVEQDGLQATTDENGEFVLNIAPQQSGKNYKLTLETTDNEGNLIKAEKSIYVADKAYEQAVDIFEITTDKEEYRPGDTARITIKTDSKIKNSFISLGRDYSRVFQVLSVVNGTATFETVIPEKYQPNFFIYAGSFFGGDWESELLEVSVNEDDKKINVDISFAKDIYGPSETAEIDITATDGLGRPVQTDLAFWLFDKALLELHGVYFEGIFEQFWKDRWFGVKTNHSFQGIYSNAAEGGGGGGGEVRSVFKDTAYWNAHVTTGSDGKAHLGVELPDNLTTWVAAAVAANAKTQVGEGLTEIKVSKDVVVRPILPAFLRWGDEIVLSALLHNFTANLEEFSVTAGFTGGEIDQQPRTTPVAAEDFEELSWSTTVTNQLSEAEFNVRAEGVGNTSLIDQVFEKITLHEYGSWQSHYQKGVGAVQLPLQLSAGTDQARAKATVTLRAFRYPQLQDMLLEMLKFSYGEPDAADSLVAASLLKEYGTRLGIPYSASELSAVVSKVMVWLTENQDDYGVWGASAEFDPQLNAFIIESLTMTEKAGFPVDKEMVEQALTYYKNWRPNEITDQAVQQYVFSLFDDQGLDRKHIELEDMRITRPTELAQTVLANARQNFTDSEKSLTQLTEIAAYESETQLAWRDFEQVDDFYALARPTAYATRAMLAIGTDLEKVEKALDYLYRNNKSTGLSSINQAIATVEYFEKSGQLSPDYIYTVLADDQAIAQGQMIPVTPQNKVVEVELPAAIADISQVKIEQAGTGKLYSTLEVAEFFTDRELKSEDHNLKVTRQYLSPKDEKLPVKPGDLVIVQFDVSGLGKGETEIEIEDYLPAGLVAVDETLDNGEFDESGINSSCIFREVTDQGMHLTFCRLFSDSGTYSYKARVVSQGVFDAPPAVVKLTNDPSIWARTAARRLVIDGKTTLELLDTEETLEPYRFIDKGKLLTGLLIVLGVIAYVKKDDIPMIIQRIKNARKRQEPE